MANVNQPSKLSILVNTVLAGFSMVLLFSCSKDNVAAPGKESLEGNAVNQASPAQVSTSIETLPFNRTFYVPCANGGEGEEVKVTGSIKIVDQIIFNENGFTLTYHANPQGLSGVGLTTGATFVGSGGRQGTLSGAYENGQFTSVFIEQLRIVGPGGTFLVNYKWHITITPDGKVTNYISGEEVDCL